MISVIMFTLGYYSGLADVFPVSVAKPLAPTQHSGVIINGLQLNVICTRAWFRSALTDFLHVVRNGCQYFVSRLRVSVAPPDFEQIGNNKHATEKPLFVKAEL